MLNALLWNLLLTAGLAIVLTGLCRLAWMHKRPALAHLLWLLLLAKLVTPPLIGLPLLPAVTDGNNSAAIATPPGEPTADRELASYQRGEEDFAIGHMPSALVDEGADTHVGIVASQGFREGTRLSYLGGLLAVSLLGTCVLLAVHAARAARLCRWLKRAGSEDPLLAETCALVASDLRIRSIVRSRVVDARTAPLLWAWRRPLVVLPRQLIDELSRPQLRGIVAHELAHYLRRDHWTNVFAFVVKVLLWWNPVVWWAARELRAAQELCCDAIAIERCGVNRRGYATTLLKALDLIQAEPSPYRELALGMGSGASILRRFEMIGETKLSYRLSRWTFVLLLVLAIPLVCMPVRAQVETAATPATTAPSDTGTADGKKDDAKKAETAETKPAEAKPAEAGDAADTRSIDPKIKELGEAVKKRITTYSDEETLTLKDGQTGRMKIKKNITPVAEILITPHFVPNGTKFDLEGVDAQGDPIGGTETTSRAIHDGQAERMGLGKLFSVKGENILSKIQLTPTRQGDDGVAVEVKVLFTRVPSPEETEAMLRTSGKEGQLHLDFQAISRPVWLHKQRTGDYPEDLEELNGSLQKDVYSPTGEDYHYEAERGRFILSSCGKDGVYGNDDDEIFVCQGGRVLSGQRHEVYPLEPLDEEKAMARTRTSVARKNKAGTETLVGERPRGDCSISGKVVSAATGKPVEHARMYLFYTLTYGAIFVNTASDGSFVFENIPVGPFSLQSSMTAGYQDTAYDPDRKSGQLPQFSLEDGEQRLGIVLEIEPARSISGKILDEDGKKPRNIDTLGVLAWVEKDNGKGYRSKQASVNRADGSYLIDGLGDKPAYVMAINWRAAQEGNAYPPIYYPGTFSRSDAKQITFDEELSVDKIDIRLQKEGGLVIEGTVTDEAGKPIPEVFVVVHRPDMLFDFVTAYTDQRGKYQIHGLGDGEFLVHLDAVHRGFVRTRAPVDLDGASERTQRDFTLTRGATISGKFVDEEGQEWQIGRSYGWAGVIKNQPESAASSPDQAESGGSFSLTAFWNKHRPQDVSRSAGGSFSLGEGGYTSGHMRFSTESSFVLQGMMPGKTVIGFLPKKEGQEVVEIIHDGQDVTKSGIETEPGQEIKDVKIVIGKR